MPNPRNMAQSFTSSFVGVISLLAADNENPAELLEYVRRLIEFSRTSPESHTHFPQHLPVFQKVVCFVSFVDRWPQTVDQDGLSMVTKAVKL